MERSLLERVTSGEISEVQAEELHERRMGSLEIAFLIEKNRRIMENHTRHGTTCDVQPHATKKST